MTGPSLCQECHGSGKCSECFGSGVNVHMNQAEPKCQNCSGSGNCPRCDGTGAARSQRWQSIR
jgi:hypothetical protein